MLDNFRASRDNAAVIHENGAAMSDTAQIDDKARQKLSKRLLKEARRKKQDMAKIRSLIEQGADVTYRNAWNGYTPMMAAMKRWNPELVILLAEHGADVETPWKGGTPLLSAAARGDADVVKTLLAKGAVHKERALISAIRWQHADVVKALFDAGARMQAVFSDSGRLKALQIAEQIGNDEVTELVRKAAEKQEREKAG